MTKNIIEIAIITQIGPRIYKRGEDFDHAEEFRPAPYETEITLHKNGRLVTFIHRSVPVVIEYARD